MYDVIGEALEWRDGEDGELFAAGLIARRHAPPGVAVRHELLTFRESTPRRLLAMIVEWCRQRPAIRFLEEPHHRPSTIDHRPSAIGDRHAG